MKVLYNFDSLMKTKDKEIIEKPIVIRVNRFNDNAAKEFHEKIDEAHNTGQTIIPVVIDSYGGYVDSFLSMASDIRNSLITVATICVGKAMSCGALLLSCGDPGFRFCDSASRIMVHDMSGGSWGKTYEIKYHADEALRLHKQVFTMMANNCEQKDDYFIDLLHDNHHSEIYMTPKQAVKHNIVQHIKIPNISVNINIDMKLN